MNSPFEYNGIIVAGLHGMLVELPGVGYVEVLPGILARLHILPYSLGF